MSNEIQNYYDQLHAAAYNRYDLADAARYITEKTFIKGQPFSFADFPFQEAALSDTSKNLCFQKPAQVGCSEMVARYALALSRIIPCFTTIYVAPFSHDANILMTTRIKPIITDSPDLKDSLDPAIDNTEIKGFGSSLLFARGASGTTQALSIPADLLIFDELDKANADIVGQYSSRLRASKWKLTRKLSTPTLKGRGINLAIQTTRRWHYVCKCHHCNNVFIPDYEEHVHIPGFDDEKKTITRELLSIIAWKQAVLLCPKCGKEPNLHKENRFWLLENPGDNYDDDYSYIISPFDAPKIHTPASITKEITNYNTYGEAQNQVLGKVSTDTQAQLTEDDIEGCMTLSALDSSNLHCMGCDMGLTCTIMIGRLTQEGILLIVHREKVLMTNFETRRRELAVKYRVLITVCDIQPYTDMIYRMQKSDKNLFGGLYIDTKGAPTFEVRHVDEKLMEGKLPVHQARIHRNNAFDNLLDMIKKRLVLWSAQGGVIDGEMKLHFTDMKRVQVFDKFNELVYTWEKSDKGVDHWHHTALYLLTACRLMPTASYDIAFEHFPIIRKFRVTEKTAPESNLQYIQR